MGKGNRAAKSGNRMATFAEELQAVIDAEFGTRAAFARAMGVTPPQVTHFANEPEKIQPKSIEAMLATIASTALQRRLYEAWARQFAPPPVLPAGLPTETVLAEINALFDAGQIAHAIAIARGELQRTDDFLRWFAIAERLQPLYLRLGQVSAGLQFLKEIERRALEAGDNLAVYSSLAMKETALQSVDAASFRHVDEAHGRSLAFLEAWSPKDAESKRIRDLRRASLSRSRALQILTYWKKKTLPDEALEAAMREAKRSFSNEAPDYLIATGLEVLGRIQAAQGDCFGAEETVERLEEFGLGKAWELWEKSRLTLAEAAKKRGDIERAMEILVDVRDRCMQLDNRHHARHADQELARLMLGI